MSVEPAVVEPALKPNHPSQRMKTPSAASGRLWPGMARGVPSAAYLPARGPRTSAPAKAAQPPTECTTVEPAKSMKPIASSQPPPLKEPAPRPRAEDGVDQSRDDDREDEVAAKLNPLGHGAGDDGGSRGGEDGLEEVKRVRPALGLPLNAHQKEAVRADPAAGGGPKHEPEADGEEHQGARGGVHDVLHDDVDGVFGAREAGLEQAKPACMKKTSAAARIVHT